LTDWDYQTSAACGVREEAARRAAGGGRDYPALTRSEIN